MIVSQFPNDSATDVDTTFYGNIKFILFIQHLRFDASHCSRCDTDRIDVLSGRVLC